MNSKNVYDINNSLINIKPIISNHITKFKNRNKTG